MIFAWDEKKNRENQRKHRISFEEAQSIFFDPLTRVAPDPNHSGEEDRFLAVGFSTKHRILMVIHCYRENEEIIRIISARAATKTERKQFQEGL